METETGAQPAPDASERVDVLSSTGTSAYTLTVAEAATLMARSEGTSAYTLTVAEAATLMARSEGTVRRLIRTGELPAAMVQGERTEEYRLRQSDVDDMRGRLNAQTAKRPRSQAHDERMDALTTRRVRVHDEDQGLMDASEGQESAQALAQHPVVQALIQATVEQATAPLVALIAGKDATIERQAEELGAAREQARQAEERAAQLERAVRRQQRPWWRRLLG